MHLHHHSALRIELQTSHVVFYTRGALSSVSKFGKHDEQGAFNAQVLDALDRFALGRRNHAEASECLCAHASNRSARCARCALGCRLLCGACKPKARPGSAHSEP